MVNSSDVRVRFAPSPTGLLHIGGLRTALYNYLFARQHDGTFILRIEDTDRTRYVESAKQDILDALEWAGLEYDEGPEVGGPHAPYYQSERQALYAEYAQQLVDDGHAYYAFDTEGEIEAMRERLKKQGQTSAKYDAVTRTEMRNSLTLSDAEVDELLEEGAEHVIRLKVPRDETIRFNDVVRGHVSFESSGLDDQVLIKSDGMPTYHMANVVDDHHMQISHVIRGEEWLSSTPKHMLLYRYLDWDSPTMAHLPLIMSPEGGKLSKRDADELGIPVFVNEYRAAGYEPEALINFLAFLGWNPGTEQELFTLDGLVEAFSLERVGSSGVQFDLDKLEWFNQQHLREKAPADLAERARPHLEAEGLAPDDAYLEEVIALVQDRIHKIEEVATTNRFFFEDPTAYEEKGVKKRWKDHSADLLVEYADALNDADTFDADTVNAILRDLADEHDVGAGKIIHPTRLAVSGLSYGPSLFDMMVVLGRETCIRRMHRAADVLG
jgi:glutamyl-tRNA synthetase